MRIDTHNLCTLCGEARLRFKLEFEIIIDTGMFLW